MAGSTEERRQRVEKELYSELLKLKLWALEGGLTSEEIVATMRRASRMDEVDPGKGGRL